MPKLVAAPADEAELRVRGRGHSAPVPIGEGELQIHAGASRHSHLRDAVKPCAPVNAAFRFVVPVFAELHGNAGRIALHVPQDRGDACDGGPDALPESAGGFFKHQARHLFLIRRVGEGEFDSLDRVVAGSAFAGWGSWFDAIEVHPEPADGGIILDGACRAFCCLRSFHRYGWERFRRLEGGGIQRQRDLVPIRSRPCLTLRQFPAILQLAPCRGELDFHRGVVPAFGRECFRGQPVGTEVPLVHGLDIRIRDSGF